ncbi:MAG: AraC family transcriptional regulator ligand-binding domain-containing protein [Alphaproteobacteria bacterium]|nr:AraC family transcriptional regulator ligand-binding domain-containing protein [Alphaproteobacteria bacterium]
MRPIALTRASQFIHVTDTVERFGLSAERLLAQAKLPAWQFCGPEDLVPAHHIYALMDAAARSLDTPIFGMLVGAQNNLATLGSFGRLVAGSLTINHAFETSRRLIPLHTSDARYWMIEKDDEVWRCRSQFQGPDFGRREMEQLNLVRMIDHVRMAAGPSWNPAKVCLQTREDPGPELREALGDPEIRLGRKVTAIAVPRALLALPLRHPNGSLEASDAEEARLRRTAPAHSFVDTLRQLVGTLLTEEGAPRIETIAEIAGTSVRSLQRRLAANGLSHTEIVDQARYQAATRLLQDADIRITDVAMDLGYTDSAHFTRAFKRWAGITPREYRTHQLMR